MIPIRGVWITNVDSTILQSRDTIRQTVQRLADVGINTLFPVVWNRSYTLYPSRVMGEYLGAGPGSIEIAPSFTGRDPLEEVIDVAQPLGLRVVPWFEYGFASSYRQKGGRIIARYPEWAGRDRHNALLTKNGFEWLNALDTNVQDFMLQLMLEVLTQYPVTGVQGDDRLPGFPVEGGYDPGTKTLYRRETGDDPPDHPRQSAWMQWRSDRLTQFLQRLYGQVKSVRAEAILSIAPSPYPFGYEEYLQDYPRWLRDGLVDWLHPQLYRRTARDYQHMVDAMLRQCGDTEAQLSTLSPGILAKSGSYVISKRDLLECLHYNRQKGVLGEVFFFAEALLQDRGTLATLLNQKGYATNTDSVLHGTSLSRLSRLWRRFKPKR